MPIIAGSESEWGACVRLLPCNLSSIYRDPSAAHTAGGSWGAGSIVTCLVTRPPITRPSEVEIGVRLTKSNPQSVMLRQPAIGSPESICRGGGSLQAGQHLAQLGDHYTDRFSDLTIFENTMDVADSCRDNWLSLGK